MMISPEGYYEEYLQGRTAEQIMTAIRGLKQEIGHLKNTMEHPEYGREPIMHPSEDVRLWCTRMYLERAKQALVEAGGIYTPSKAEMQVAEFEKSIPSICKVVFTIGGFFSGHETHTITLDDKHLHMDVEHSFIPKPSNFFIEADYPLEKDEFLEGIRGLYISEWRRTYDTRRFGYEVLDGTQWELKIFFSDGHKPVVKYGSNSYPYNFNKFLELLGIDPESEEMEDDD